MAKYKETERGTPDKKTRKSSSTNIANDVAPLPPLKLVKDEDVYLNVVKFEEEESKKRAADNDSALFLETCEKLKIIFAEISHLKTLNTPKAEEEIKEKRIQGSFLFVMLKKLNRLDKVRLRAGRDALQKEKFQVEKNKLQLQNLLYEADHLRKEVQHCLQFKSHDEEIDLVPLEEFYREAPSDISRRDKTEADEHARRLARLEWELHQRKQLSIMCNELQAAKEKVAEEIESKTNRLDSLIPCLDSLLKATRPLQEALEINIEKEWSVQKVANLLPRPLYVVYMNLSAYAEISDPLVTAVINGDEDEAKELDSTDKPSAEITDEVSQDSDADDNDQENYNEHSMKKHHHRRQTSIAIAKVNVFKPHPLNVTFTVKVPEAAGASLSMTLHYLPALRFITVQTKLTDFVPDGIAACDVLNSNNILNCLVSDRCVDNEMLHSKSVYTLKELSLDSTTFLSKLTEFQLGKPYGWAQKLCGLQFIACTQSTDTCIDYELTQQTVPNIVKKIRSRLQSRVSLYRQILDLEQKNIENLLLSSASTSSSSLSSVRVLCTLVQWTSITWNEYVERNAMTAKFIDEMVVTTDHLLYCAIIIRGSAKLECLISISPNFPNACPLWAISLSWNSIRNASNNSDIRELEHWINSIEASRKNVSSILGIQLKRAMSSLDIYLETESVRSDEQPMEFQTEKTFFKPFRGRTHARPYKVVQNGGSVICTQI